MDKKKETLKDDIVYNSETGEISVNGKVVANWDDEANVNYPEDLIWMRDIGGLFCNAYSAGKAAASADSANEIESLKARIAELEKQIWKAR